MPAGCGSTVSKLLARNFGTFPRVLGVYAREKKLLRLEEAVRKMSSLPADTFRLRDRGRIVTGALADLVILDADRVSSPATFQSPHHYAVGFTDVVVNGVPVIREGRLTNARPGRAIRRADRY